MARVNFREVKLSVAGETGAVRSRLAFFCFLQPALSFHKWVYISGAIPGDLSEYVKVW